MLTLKKYLPVIVIVLPVIIAVIIRSSGTGHFRYDAARWAEPAVSGKNIITPGMLSSLKDNPVIIYLSGDRPAVPVHPGQVSVSPDSLLKKDVIRTIAKNKGAVVLYSEDQAMAARIWMLLSQSGIRELYILTTEPDNETLKEEFRTDTMARPESL